MSDVPRVAALAAGIATIMISPEFDPNLRIDLIDVHQNARSALGDLSELTGSIAAVGVLQPISVIREGGRFKVWLGHRRRAACIAAGMTTIPAMIHPPMSEADFTLGQVVENIQNESMSDADLYRSVKELERLGQSKTEISAKLGKSNSFVTQCFAPDRLCPELLAIFMAGKMTKGDAYLIARSEDATEQMAAYEARKGGVKRDDLAKKKTKTEESGKPPERHEKALIPSASAVVIVKAKKGKEPFDLATTKTLLTEALAKVEAAIKAGYGIKTASRAWADTKHKVKPPRKPRKPREAS